MYLLKCNKLAVILCWGEALLLVFPGLITWPQPGAAGSKTASLLGLGFGTACQLSSLSKWLFIIHGLGELIIIMLESLEGSEMRSIHLFKATETPTTSFYWSRKSSGPPTFKE